MRTMTFQSVSKSRGCAEFGPYHYVHTDTVHEDGSVGWSVKGTDSDGKYVNESGTRRASVSLPLDFDSIRAAREASGWRVIGG